MSKELAQTFLPGRQTNGQQAHEKMLNITNHQRNANQNDNEIPFHTHWGDYNEEDERQHMVYPHKGM